MIRLVMLRSIVFPREPNYNNKLRVSLSIYYIQPENKMTQFEIVLLGVKLIQTKTGLNGLASSNEKQVLQPLKRVKNLQFYWSEEFTILLIAVFHNPIKCRES